MKKIGPAMCVEYVDANNRRFVISFAASRIDHQIYLAISRYEALIEGFLTHVFVPNSASDRERNNKYKFAASFAPLLRFLSLSLSLSLHQHDLMKQPNSSRLKFLPSFKNFQVIKKTDIKVFEFQIYNISTIKKLNTHESSCQCKTRSERSIQTSFPLRFGPP